MVCVVVVVWVFVVTDFFSRVYVCVRVGVCVWCGMVVVVVWSGDGGRGVCMCVVVIPWRGFISALFCSLSLLLCPLLSSYLVVHKFVRELFRNTTSLTWCEFWTQITHALALRSEV